MRDYPQTWTDYKPYRRLCGFSFHYRAGMVSKDRNHPDLRSRIEHILREEGWKQSDLARELGCGTTTVNNWLVRNQGMDPRYAFILQDKHCWNARWLLEGVGPAKMQVVDKDAEALIDRIRDLPPERRRALATLLDAI